MHGGGREDLNPFDCGLCDALEVGERNPAKNPRRERTRGGQKGKRPTTKTQFKTRAHEVRKKKETTGPVDRKNARKLVSKFRPAALEFAW